MKRQASSGGEAGASPQKVAKTGQVQYFDLSCIAAAFVSKTITQWDSDFYNNIHGKESLSEKQKANKERIDFKMTLHAAKGRNVLNDFEVKFSADNFGKDADKLSAKQKDIKAKVDTKIGFWNAHKAKVISDWDLDFMVSNAAADKLSGKQQAHKDRIEKQLAATDAVLQGGVLDDFETTFFRDNAGKESEKLSAKQKPIMGRIEEKLRAWNGFKDEQITEWDFNFLLSIAGKDTLSEKQQKVKDKIDKNMKSDADEES